MKKIVIGCFGILSSVLLFGMTLITSAIYSICLVQPHTQGYYNWHLGYFGSALVSIGITPLLISLILFFIGINYLKKGVKE